MNLIREVIFDGSHIIHIQSQEILKIKLRLNTLMAKHTGQSLDQVTADTERDNFMSAEESKDYGLVDEVLDKRG